MTIVRDHNLSSVDRPLALRARGDIRVTSVSFSGQTGYVLKDPLTLGLFHLTAEEHFLFDSIREAISLSQLRRDFEQRFAPRRVTHEALQQGLNNLYSQGLLLGDAPAQGQELWERSERRRRSERMQGLLQLLSFRIGSIDATGVVDGLYGMVRWLFSWPAMLFAVLAMCHACWILLGHSSEVMARLPSLAELAQPKYWLLWLATVVAVKVIHELAHATTCHHFGGRCHELGVLLLAFIPCLYCDVTDVWRLPNKWQRMAVSAAGMAAELVIASLALIAWWYTEPGLLHTWCLSLVIVCSVGTLLVNLNPLLRYDGYYILSDLVEVPNLAGRSQGLLPTALKHWLLGQPRVQDPLLSRRLRRGLMIYAVATRVYLTLVLLGIFAMLLAWAAPFRFDNLVYTLGVFVLLGMLFKPASGLWQMLRNPRLRQNLRGLRVFLLGAGVAAVMVLVFYWPISQKITGPIVFVAAQGRAVYATKAGELLFAVTPGDRVHRGDVIARLAEPEFEMALARQEGELEVRRARYHQLESMRAWDVEASQLLPTAEAAVVDAESRLTQLRSQGEELTVTAPASGVIVGAADVEHAEEEGSRLSRWSGSPLDRCNLGSWVESGTVLCSVAEPGQMEALLRIDQQDVAEVSPGQLVRIRLDSAPTQILEGKVLEVARRAEQPKGSAAQSLALQPYHLVQVQLKQQNRRQFAGLRGRATIKTPHSTLGQMLASELREMLRIPW